MTKTGASLEWGSGGSDHGGDGTREILPAGRPQAHYTFSESNRDSSNSLVRLVPNGINIAASASLYRQYAAVAIGRLCCIDSGFLEHLPSAPVPIPPAGGGKIPAAGMFEIPGKRVAVKFYGRTRCSGPDDRAPAQRKKVEARVAPTFVLKYNIRTGC